MGGRRRSRARYKQLLADEIYNSPAPKKQSCPKAALFALKSEVPGVGPYMCFRQPPVPF